MPSSKTKTSRSAKKTTSKNKILATARRSQKMLFWPVVSLTFLLWIAYRTLFDFPIWFDETLGKAIFFALPVWFFIIMTRNKEIADSFSIAKIKQGLLQGIAFGGMFGFAASLIVLFSRTQQVESALLFMSDAFWWEFFLALMTGFWETMFFYAFVMTLIQMIYSKWPLINQVLLTSFIFIIFHIPNLVTLFSGRYLLGYILLIWAFSIGQAFIYARRQNAYTLILSHAIWGMVLLIHVQS